MKKRISILVMLATVTISGFSQGSWNIGYIQIDSISSADINKIVRPDFKQAHPRYIETKYKSARYFAESKDTGHINFKGKIIELIEVRKIYPDHGDYRDQYLECPGYESNRLLGVYDSEVMEVKKDSILFRLHLEIYNKKKGKAAGEPQRDTALCWIEKEKLDGVLIKR